MQSLTFLIAMVSGLIAQLAISSADDGSHIIIAKPWARASILQSRPGATYLTIRNTGNAADRLLGVTSPQAGKVMVHTSKLTNGIMSMRAVTDLEVGAGGTVAMQPGGMHLMLTQLREPLRKGQRLEINLQFEKAGRLQVSVPILSVGARGADDE
jgi:copper(I)-binding protein